MCSYATVFVLVLFAFVLVHINQLSWHSTAFMLTKTLCFVCFLYSFICCEQICLLDTKCT